MDKQAKLEVLIFNLETNRSEVEKLEETFNKLYGRNISTFGVLNERHSNGKTIFSLKFILDNADCYDEHMLQESFHKHGLVGWSAEATFIPK